MEQAGRRRRDSLLQPDSEGTVSDPSGATTEGKTQLTGPWTTVNEQRALFEQSAAMAKPPWADHPRLVALPTFGNRSNVAVDLWWMSPFLPEEEVSNPREMLPPPGWRASIRRKHLYSELRKRGR